MSLSPSFKRKLQSTLRIYLKNYSISSIQPEEPDTICGYNLIKWDFIIKLRVYNIDLIIEVERKRPDPIHNFIKTLIWIEENNPANKIIFLHVFDSVYSTGDKPNKEMCDFVWRSIRTKYKSLLYHSLNISGLSDSNENPPKYPIKRVCDRISQVAENLVKAEKNKLDRIQSRVNRRT